MLFSFWQFWEKQGRFVFFGLGIGLVVLGLIIFLTKADFSASDVEFLPAPVKTEEISGPPKIAVDLAGAVVDPGVYRFEGEIRLGQAIETAGGFTDQADQDWVAKHLNLAGEIKDGAKFYIPTAGEEFSLTDGEAGPSGLVAGASTGLVKINSASQKELESLPGIGPSFASAIIEYREKNNGFITVEEIVAVSGIGPKTFEKIKDKIEL
ncbi:helix-hairpin-helix domain-containing protein [Patescibacteria group bacterium]|nr:helix-hairpin-helix domain-containing protein [Patescibacteria group bacterium]